MLVDNLRTTIEISYQGPKSNCYSICFKKFWHYWCGEKCEIFTDHKSLNYLFTQKGLNMWQRRWENPELVIMDSEHKEGRIYWLLVQPELIERSYMGIKRCNRRKLPRVVQQQSGFRGRNPLRREECNNRENSQIRKNIII